MKNIKDFKKFINEELNPETYDKVMQIGTDRNDPRGKRLIDMSRELKFKNAPGSILNLYNVGGDYLGKFSVRKNDIKSFDNTIWIEGEFNGNRSFLFFNSIYTPYQINIKYDKDVFKNEEILLDRSSINSLVKIFNDMEWTKYTKPSSYKSI